MAEIPRWQTPISRWQLDGNANDLYGLNNGTENSTTYTTDSKQGSKAMSGGSVVLPTLIYRTSGYTFSAWFKNPGILNQFKNGSTFPRVNMVYTSGESRLYYYIHSAAGSVIFTDYLSYSDVNNWHHIVITDTGGTVRGYFDGAISTISGTYTPQELTTLNTCSISGGLDDVRFYDTALTADEVMNLYKSYATPIWQQPLHHWKLDGDAIDSAGSRNGTATNISYNSASKISGNYSAIFNGSSSNINVGDWSWASYTNFSVSAWFKVSGVSDAILTCTRPGYKFPRLQLILGSVGVLKYAVVDDAGSVLLDIGAPKASNDDIWHHIILIDANGTVTGYLDGFISFTGSYTRENLSNLTRVTMGALINEIIDRPLFGLLDDVRFYDVALSAADVRALYNSYFTEKATNFMSML